MHTHEICGDCLCYLANGDLPPDLSETETAAYHAAVHNGPNLVPSDWTFTLTPMPDDFEIPEREESSFTTDEYGTVYQTDWTDDDRYYGHHDAPKFSRFYCDLCSRPYGGDRYPATEV